MGTKFDIVPIYFHVCNDFFTLKFSWKLALYKSFPSFYNTNCR